MSSLPTGKAGPAGTEVGTHGGHTLAPSLRVSLLPSKLPQGGWNGLLQEAMSSLSLKVCKQKLIKTSAALLWFCRSHPAFSHHT